MNLMDVKLEIKIVGLVIIALLISALLSVILSIYFIRNDTGRIVSIYSGISVDFIKYAIEETMVTGNPDATRDLIKKRSSLQGVESIMVLDAEGQGAFSTGEGGLLEDVEIINRIKKSKSTFTQQTEDSNIYYIPLINTIRCTGCHDKGGNLLGAIKVSMSTRDVNKMIAYRTKSILISLLSGILLLGIVLWLAFKKAVINPVKELKDAAGVLSHGDLSFHTSINSRDEIGILNQDMRKAVRGIGNIIQRTGAVSKRVVNVTNDVEKESKKVVEGTQLESEAVNTILSSTEELNKSMGEIAENVEGLSISAEQTATSVDEMVANTEEITRGTFELSSAVDSTSSSMEEMSATIKEVAHQAEELSTSAEQTLSATEEINSTIKDIESNIKESARLSEKVTSDASGFGMASIEKTIEGMERIKTTVQKTAEFIEKLGSRSEEIGKILNVIDEVTDQTTLLALNAAILAAQAGEHGKGFSVVADEIKDLAERTSFSTQEIAELIKTVQSEVRGAVNAMSEGLKTVEDGFRLSMEAKESLKKIIGSSKKSTEMAFSIERATSEQTKGTRFVTDAMEKVKDMIGQIAKATSEQAKGVSLIMSASEKIRDITKHVKNASVEQSKGGKQIYKAVEDISIRIHEISKALNEQKIGSDNILNSLEKIKDLPLRNRKIAFSMNNALRNLLKDAELLMTELGRFKIAIEEERPDILKMGVMPLESPAEMYKCFSPLTGYLVKELKKKVELKIAIDFAETVEDIGEGITDICYMTPSTYIEAKNKYNVEVIAKALRKGKPYHHTVIIAREGRNINSIDDIKGRSFAFGDRHSTSSYIMPTTMLREAGIDLDDLSFYDYLGHHDDVAKAVLDGEFDAGGVMESTAEKFKSQGLKFIKYSAKIPEFNICVKKNMPEEEKLLIKEAFLKLDENITEHKEILRAINPEYTGFVESRDSDYDGIREVMQKLGLL